MKQINSSLITMSRKAKGLGIMYRYSQSDMLNMTSIDLVNLESLKIEDCFGMNLCKQIYCKGVVDQHQESTPSEILATARATRCKKQLDKIPLICS